MDTSFLLSIGSFISILAVLVRLRMRNTRFEVKSSDIVVAIIPIVVFLLVTGKLQKFEIGEGGVKIETAFVKASESAITTQVAVLKGWSAEPIQIDSKTGTSEIPRLIEQKTEGLRFRLNFGGYYGPAIEEYLIQLTKYPYLNYIIIENSDGTFFALAKARELITQFQAQRPPITAKDLADWLNTGNRDALARLPGFIAAQQAVTQETDKGQVLQKMESLNVEILPVINDKKQFTGIVNRSRLTASLLIDVVKDIKK